MIGDLICDRKDGAKYSARDFYFDVMNYRETCPEWADAITAAMDEGTEQDVICALCKYIQEAGWNRQLCDYVSSVKWLDDDPQKSFQIKVTFQKGDKQQPFTFSTYIAYIEDGGIQWSKDFDQNMQTIGEALRKRMFFTAWAMAERMGWKPWKQLTVEVPSANFKLTMKPKTEEAAQWLQQKLEKK